MQSPEHQTNLRILQELKENWGIHVSGAYLARKLAISRTAIWKHIQILQSKGYNIATTPRRGYYLTGLPNSLIPEELVPRLNTTWIGKHYHHFNQIESTNDHALALGRQGAPHGTIVVSEAQTKGRGRMQRPWLSIPRCGIYMSMLLRTPILVREAYQPTLVAALALTKTFRERFGLPAKIKWPNDILIRGMKVSGLLSEMQSEQDFVHILVIGVGINVNHSSEDLEGSFRYPVTSAAMQLGRPVDRLDLLSSFLEFFELEYETYMKDGFQALLPKLEKYSAILGKHVTLLHGESEITGIALGLNSEGALRLLMENGDEKEIWVGDVTHVRGEF